VDNVRMRALSPDEIEHLLESCAAAFRLIARTILESLPRVLSGNSIALSRGSMIVAQEPGQPRATMDGTVRTWWCDVFRSNQLIVKALVIPFPVIMRHERSERPA
jgi:hypothetical protein